MDGNAAASTPAATPEAPDPPFNIEAEQFLLGAILVNNDAYARVSQRLRAEHFMEPVHRRVYEAIERAIAAGVRADPIILARQFDQDGALAEIGGAKYLVRLAVNVVTIINAPDYANEIIDCWERRQLIDIADRMRERANRADRGLDYRAGDAIRDTERDIAELEAKRPAVGQLMHASLIANAHIEAVGEAYKAGGRITGLPTGLTRLDNILGGLSPVLTVLAGRPGIGKSLCAGVIAQNVAQAAGPVVIFSLEQQRSLWLSRWIARLTGIPTDKQSRGAVASADFERMMMTAQEIGSLPIWIDETPHMSLNAMKESARRTQRRHGLALVIVDHIGLVRASDSSEKHGGVAPMTEITRDLVGMSKDLGVPVLALSQLSRAVELRENKRPVLSDLRESGSIEQDAHAVIFLYRHAYYLEREPPQMKAGESAEKFQTRENDHHDALEACRNALDLIVAKNRSGPSESLRVWYDGARCDVRDDRFAGVYGDDRQADMNF